jgi:uncharacterized membrane protein YkvA (DUF1232 family)
MLAYLASPIDLIPDFIPVFGQLDDALVIVLALRYLLRGTSQLKIKEHWPGPETSLQTLLRLSGVR